MDYNEFLQSKIKLASATGFDIDESLINPALKPHNKIMVKWLVEGGRRACFANFGLHKTVTQLETVRLTLTNTGGRGLIVCPLNIVYEFEDESTGRLGWEEPPRFIRDIKEAGETGIYLTNYETVRDGKLDPRKFQCASLDEASVLRGLGSTKTFREFMRLFTGDGGPLGDRRGKECVPYRWVATATPSPNEYIELLAYADFLGIMDVSQAKTRFFKRDSTKADKLTLHEHKEEEFWLWVASWALFVLKPSDLTGNPEDDKDYQLPEMQVNWHEIKTDHSAAGCDRNGQALMFRDTAIGIIGAAKEKQDSIDVRIAKMLELKSQRPDDHCIIWHDLENERRAIEKAIPSVVSVYGSQDINVRSKIIRDFSNGLIKDLAAKPVMLGSGCNLQRHCSWAIFLGIGFKFNDFIQAIHRLMRILQKYKVTLDLIYTEAEIQARRKLEKSWTQHNKMVKHMTDIIKQYGLTNASMASSLFRKMGVPRAEIKGTSYKIVNNDSVLEMDNVAENSVGLILTSIPFSNQYEYSPNYADFGHSDNNSEFFKQMDYLTPKLLKALIPGRIAAIHVKDRIIPGGMNGAGFQTTYPFHIDCFHHYTKHGFEYLGMKTIVTDVVRENNQTYRLGWTEQCKDGSKMGVGMPEYLLLFRKRPTDTSNAYSDIPVVKQKPLQKRPDGTTQPYNKNERLPIVPGTGYSRGRWQTDAHGFGRSSGNRLIMPEEYVSLDADVIFKLFREYSLNNVYDYEHHVAIAEALEQAFKLPPGFMLLQPQSWSPEVWTDITRMQTLNGRQWSIGKEMHICPMQFDIADRVIVQMSNPGDIVLDPFGGLMTVPYRAIMHGRYGFGIELNPTYFIDGASYCKAADVKHLMPNLFDITETAA